MRTRRSPLANVITILVALAATAPIFRAAIAYVIAIDSRVFLEPLTPATAKMIFILLPAVLAMTATIARMVYATGLTVAPRASSASSRR